MKKNILYKLVPHIRRMIVKCSRVGIGKELKKTYQWPMGENLTTNLAIRKPENFIQKQNQSYLEVRDFESFSEK